jgi:hypothetical protein
VTFYLVRWGSGSAYTPESPVQVTGGVLAGLMAVATPARVSIYTQLSHLPTAGGCGSDLLGAVAVGRAEHSSCLLSDKWGSGWGQLLPTHPRLCPKCGCLPWPQRQLVCRVGVVQLCGVIHSSVCRAMSASLLSPKAPQVEEPENQ